jgi:hypothetical protein
MRHFDRNPSPPFDHARRRRMRPIGIAALFLASILTTMTLNAGAGKQAPQPFKVTKDAQAMTVAATAFTAMERRPFSRIKTLLLLEPTLPTWAVLPQVTPSFSRAKVRKRPGLNCRRKRGLMSESSIPVRVSSKNRTEPSRVWRRITLWPSECSTFHCCHCYLSTWIPTPTSAIREQRMSMARLLTWLRSVWFPRQMQPRRSGMSLTFKCCFSQTKSPGQYPRFSTPILAKPIQTISKKLKCISTSTNP